MLRRWHFDLWYLFRPPWDSGTSPPELLDFIATHTPGRAIDLGCGTGTNVITLARDGWRVTGIDFSPRAIRMAKSKVQMAGLSADLRVGDVTQMKDVQGPFDLALDLGCFHGLPTPGPYLMELERIADHGAFWLMYAIMASGSRSSFGLNERTLELVEQSGWTLISRENGLDRRSRPSAWFLYQRD